MADLHGEYQSLTHHYELHPAGDREARVRQAFHLCLAMVLSVWAQSAIAQTPPDVAKANQADADTEALTRMHDHFTHAAQIEFKTSFVETSDLPGMDRRGIAHFIIQRPNKFRIELTSNKGDYLSVSDGTTLTIYQPAAAKYALIPARDSIMGTMYTAVGLLGTQARLIDFLWTIDYGENVIVKPLESKRWAERPALATASNASRIPGTSGSIASPQCRAS